MRDLRETEAVTQLEDAPRCLSCDGLLGDVTPGTCNRPCSSCGAMHHAAGRRGVWYVRPIGNEPTTDQQHWPEH